jgi:hypothetical protein
MKDRIKEILAAVLTVAVVGFVGFLGGCLLMLSVSVFFNALARNDRKEERKEQIKQLNCPCARAILESE